MTLDAATGRHAGLVGDATSGNADLTGAARCGQGAASRSNDPLASDPQGLADGTFPAHESLWYGGRVILCAGSGCLVCLQLLDQEQIALDQMDQHERQADERIYGVARGALRGPGPSVVSVNGAVASLAVTEFMVHITGLRAPVAQLTYRADLGTVTKSLDQPAEGCYYCEGLWRAPSLDSPSSGRPSAGRRIRRFL